MRIFVIRHWRNAYACGGHQTYLNSRNDGEQHHTVLYFICASFMMKNACKKVSQKINPRIDTGTPWNYWGSLGLCKGFLTLHIWETMEGVWARRRQICFKNNTHLIATDVSLFQKACCNYHYEFHSLNTSVVLHADRIRNMCSESLRAHDSVELHCSSKVGMTKKLK